VKINDNSARRHQSAPIPISALPGRRNSTPPPRSPVNSSASPDSAPCLHASNSNRNSLIANPRLEFAPGDSKISPVRISNREYIAVFHFTFHPLRPLLGSSPAIDHVSPTAEILIGTPRLEFPATHTKQSPDPISNRDTSGTFPIQNLTISAARKECVRRTAGAPTGNRSAIFTGGPGVGS